VINPWNVLSEGVRIDRRQTVVTKKVETKPEMPPQVRVRTGDRGRGEDEKRGRDERELPWPIRHRGIVASVASDLPACRLAESVLQTACDTMSGITSDRLAVGAVFLTVSALAMLSPVQSDTWWHLRAGQDVWRHAWPFVERYSWTAAGRPWPNLEWLSEAIFYVLFRVGGLRLLEAACGTVIVAAWAVSWHLTTGPFELRFPLFAGSLAAAAAGWAVRPVEFSHAAFIATVWLLTTNRLPWLPLLFLLWVNLHGGVVLGGIAIAAAGAAVMLVERKVPLLLVASGAGCALATLISPMGWKLVPEIAASLGRSRLNQLSEWQPPGFSAWLWPFWIIAAALVIITLIYWRRFDRRTAILTAVALAILPLAVRAVRNVPVFLLVGVPATTAALMPPGWKSRTPSTAGEHTRVNAALLAAMGSVAVAVVALSWRASIPALGWRPISTDAARAIATCNGPMYNTYAQGGILLWFLPDKPVFIDNRQDPYPDDLLATNRALEISGDYRSAFERYGVRCAVVPPGSPTARGLETDRDWRRTFADAAWTVFSRR
jgi:hypothetical protein